MTTDGTPLSIAGVTRLVRVALKGSDYINPARFTLHALRRGAVHACVAGGASLEQVKELGHWASDAVKAYLPQRSVSAAPATLKACLVECCGSNSNALG